MRALAAATRYGEWRARDHGERVAPAGIDRRAAEALVDAGARRVDPEGRRLTRDEAAAAAGGLRHRRLGQRRGGAAPTRRSRRPSGSATRWCSSRRRPLLRHQVDVGGVRVDLAHRDERARGVRAALRERLAPLGGRLASSCSGWPRPGVAVRHQHRPRTRCSARWSASASPGRRPSCSATSAYRIPPLTDVDVSDLISSVRAAPAAARPPRRRAGATVAALADLIARVSVLADDLPEVASLDAQPGQRPPGRRGRPRGRGGRRPGLRAPGHRSPGARRSAQGWGDGHHLAMTRHDGA